MWNAHNTVFDSKRSAVYAALSAVLLIYNFQFRPVFLPRRLARRHRGGTVAYLVYPTSDIRRRRKFVKVFCTERTGQGNDYELISTSKN